jgi:hypothetical protein
MLVLVNADITAQAAEDEGITMKALHVQTVQSYQFTSPASREEFRKFSTSTPWPEVICRIFFLPCLPFSLSFSGVFL